MRHDQWPLLPFDLSLLLPLLPDFDVVVVRGPSSVQNGAGGHPQVDVPVLLGPRAPNLQTPGPRPPHTPTSNDK